ncbi:MAG: hypothetical protein IPK82_22085 [Polyangiaceae bacterium]|nr:hypothetical protein [Polyangiaceae bacterium]
MDIALLSALLLSFATFVTIHVVITVRLLGRKEDRWRGAVAIFVPPVAPVWAVERGWKRSAIAWVTSLIVYAVALTIALR